MRREIRNAYGERLAYSWTDGAGAGDTDSDSDSAGHLRPGVDCMLEKPHCPLSAAFLADLIGVHSVTSRAPSVRVPWLLVHGNSDDIVPNQDSMDMVVVAAPQSPDHVELPGIDQTFSGAGISSMTNVVVPWLADACRSQSKTPRCSTAPCSIS